MPGTRTGAYASCGDAQIPYDRSKRLADEHKNLAGHQTDLESRPMSQKYSFRFMHLRDEALRDLRTIEKDEDGVRELVIHPQFGAPEKYAVTWDLREGMDYVWIKSFVEQHGLEDDTYGVFVSLVTDRGGGRIRAPKFVIDLSRAVGGVIDFSFTVV